MKKLFTVLFVLLAVSLMGGMADAIRTHTPNVAVVDVNAAAGAGAIDCDVKSIPNGIAGGISGAGGVAGATAAGIVTNGNASGYVTAVGGGITDTDAYKWNPYIGDKSIGVGVRSDSEAMTGATFDIGADACLGAGVVGAVMGGAAGQGTLVGSGLIESPRFFSKSTGYTGGIAGQGSIGAFCGEGVAGVLWYGEAGAEAGALITMSGFSQSDSWRAVDWFADGKKEMMGTNVGVGTNVEATGYNGSSDSCLAYGSANVDGGWVAKGAVSTRTVQTANNGSGGAIANATGAYHASGGLNSTYAGSAIGYSQTSITTFDGMNGSINSAAAGMQVTSGPALLK